MKRLFCLFVLSSVLFNTVYTQILNPVKWSFESKKISDTEFDLIASARLDRGWHIYSQTVGDDGPIPTKLTFKPSPQYQLLGKTNEVSDHKKSGYDKIFDMNITKFSDEVKFIQRVKLSGDNAQIKGTVEFQSCDDEKCLPPQEEDFNYNLSAAAGSSRGAVTPPPTPNGNTPPSVISQPITPQTPNNTGVAANNSQIIQPTLPNPSKSGIHTPVKWAFESKKNSANEYNLIFKATIEKGWHIYSQFLKGDMLIPTSFNFNKNSNFELVGKASEESPQKRRHKEPLFNNMEVVDFSGTATFTQRVKVTDVSKPITGKLEYAACDDKQCTPPTEVPFSFNLETGQAQEIAETPTIIQPQSPSFPVDGGIILTPDGFSFDKKDEATTCSSAPSENEDFSSLWMVFLLGFGGGLLALLTPCVFPMIPLTVSFFIKGSKDRKKGLQNALLYAASIIVIYVGMGLLITAVFGSDALNRLSTNPWVNIAFGILFLVFAFSFFGYFEITLPSSWTNKADSAANRGGGIGIFFMAFTLALVSFSCTGPIIGTLLVQTATTTGISVGPAIGMLGFASALALPFGLFALFPAWLHSLPKSGGWMDDVKVTLGFIEVALAFKFISNADLIKGWKILPYEAFLAIWILCALGLALYHLGILKIHGHSSDKKFTLTHKIVAGLSIAFAVYLGLGYRFNPVSETFKTPEFGSGILPPAGYSYIYPQKCPLNINCFHDLNEGLAYAKQVNKPILLDFTGWNCANCRKMEENVWNQPGVLELIRDKYVLISLYTDDKNELKHPYKAYTSKFDGKLKDTEGEMWTDLEATHFNKNSQPFYVLMTPERKVLNTPVAYTPEVDDYKAFLECGLNRFSDIPQKTLSSKD